MRSQSRFGNGTMASLLVVILCLLWSSWRGSHTVLVEGFSSQPPSKITNAISSNQKTRSLLVHRNNSNRDDAVDLQTPPQVQQPSQQSQQQQQQQQQQQPSNQVNVQVQCWLPALSTIPEARRAWLEFVWEKGGGLPLLGVVGKTVRTSTSELETTMLRRELLPLLMQEELLLDDSSTGSQNDASQKIQYQVKNSGLLATKIVPDSHLGIVTLEKPDSGNGGIRLTWNVTFSTTSASRTWFWQALTERTITETCHNLQAAVAVPKLYTRITTLRPLASKSTTTTTTATLLEHGMTDWIQFCWKEGAGLPLPIPPIRGDKNNVRWTIPPFLKERILSTNIVENDNSRENKNAPGCYAEILYQVDNPNLITYQVHSHRGRVRFFIKDNDETTKARGDEKNNTIKNTPLPTTTNAITMKWEIEIRPYRGWTAAVQTFTAAVVSCYARNFKCHVQEGGNAMVNIKPPRGSTGKVLWRVKKDSWIGGVLDSHLKDSRSTAEQTIAMFQPWTWGRTKDNYDENDEGEHWTEGYFP